MQVEARTPRTRTLTDLDLPLGREYEVDGICPSFKYFPPSTMNGIEMMPMSDMAEDHTLSSAEGTPEAFSTGTLKTARAKKEPSRKSIKVASASWVYLVSRGDDIGGRRSGGKGSGKYPQWYSLG